MTTKVTLRFDTGHPTGLQNAPRLAALLERDGPPDAIIGNKLVWVRAVGRYAAEWDYTLSSNQLQFRGQRQLVGVELS